MPRHTFPRKLVTGHISALLVDGTELAQQSVKSTGRRKRSAQQQQQQQPRAKLRSLKAGQTPPAAVSARTREKPEQPRVRSSTSQQKMQSHLPLHRLHPPGWTRPSSCKRARPSTRQKIGLSRSRNRDRDWSGSVTAQLARVHPPLPAPAQDCCRRSAVTIPAPWLLPTRRSA